MSPGPDTIVGLMSGTSLDGMDAAVVRIWSPERVELAGFAHRPYSTEERKAIESVLDGADIAAVARLHAAIADWAADAVEVALALAGVAPRDVTAIAFPGQTVWHQPPVVTYQIGEPAILAERFGVRVVSDFRSRDVAAGGEGAPLVPLADALTFASPDQPRVLLNIGGMANVSWVRRRGDLEHVIAADTGPGMAIIDAVARLVDPALPFDVDAKLAARGRSDAAVLAELLNHAFFRSAPPRSTGRELFGAEFARELYQRVPGPDAVRTAVALTAESIAHFCRTFLPPAPEVVASGGGVHHPVLMDELATRLAERDTALRRFDAEFFSGDAKEAVAFALIAWFTLRGKPGNVPAATGARGYRVLGSVTAP